MEWYSAGDGFTWDSADLDESRAKAVAAWEFSAGLVAAGNHRLVVLDEISYAMTWGWIDAGAVVAALAGRPERVNVILTGRDMAAEVIEVADTVTEMGERQARLRRRRQGQEGDRLLRRAAVRPSTGPGLSLGRNLAKCNRHSQPC